MPLLEERQREPDEMAEQSCAKGEVERVLKDHDNQRPQPGYGDRERRNQSEAKRQHQQQVDIAPGDDFVHGELQIEGSGDHQNFEHQRQGQDL